MGPDYLEALDPAARQRLLSTGGRRSYPARSYLFHEGDEPTGVLMVEAGLLRVDRTSASGRVVLLDLATAGSLCGELGVIDDAPRSATASTVTECTIRHIPAGVFREVLGSNLDAQAAIIRRLTRRLRALSTQFVETSTMDAPSRIAARLVRLVEIDRQLGTDAVSHSGIIDLKLPISQEDLGHWSGLSREGAVKGLTILRSIGLIETGRKRVVILDYDALAARAAAI